MNNNPSERDRLNGEIALLQEKIKQAMKCSSEAMDALVKAYGDLGYCDQKLKELQTKIIFDTSSPPPTTQSQQYTCSKCRKTQDKPFRERYWDGTKAEWKWRPSGHCETCDNKMFKAL